MQWLERALLLLVIVIAARRRRPPAIKPPAADRPAAQPGDRTLAHRFRSIALRLLVAFLFFQGAFLILLLWLSPALEPSTPRAIAVGAPVATGVHTGFEVRVVATLRTCRDSVVSYRVVLVAPKQLSPRDRRALRSRGARLALAVDGDEVSDARFDAGTGSVPAAVEVTGGKRAITVLSGRVDRRPDDHDTVEFVFEAPWHSRRSGPPLIGQSCWVQLPAIVGIDALDFADDLESTEGRVWNAVTVSARREPPELVQSTIATSGRSTLIVGGRILASDSVPTPDRLLPSGAQFKCRGEPRRFGIRQTDDESVPELPLVGRARIDYQEASPPAFAGCGASVGVADPSADVVADFLLVVAGVLLGFAIHQVPRRRIAS